MFYFKVLRAFFMNFGELIYQIFIFIAFQAMSITALISDAGIFIDILAVLCIILLFAILQDVQHVWNSALTFFERDYNKLKSNKS